MGESGSIPDLLFGSQQTFILLVTAAFGLVIGKIIRTVFKFGAYAAALIALFVLGLHYLGIIYVTVNFKFLSEIVQGLYHAASQIGIAEHLFFWVPVALGFRSKKLARPL